MSSEKLPTEKQTESYTPYKGDPESWHGSRVGMAWRNGGGGNAVTTLCGEVDGAEFLTKHGFASTKFGKQVGVAMRGLYRAGMTHTQIEKKVAQIIAKSPEDVKERLTSAASSFLQKIIIKEDEDKKMEAAILNALGKSKLENERIGIAPKRLFARILSRAKHCYRAEGGALSVGQIAERLGFRRSKSPKSLGMQVVLSFFGDCERAGLLVVSGQEEPRTYRLIQPE